MNSNAEGGFKRFSGAGANGSDLKRWKTWCLSKMITMTTLTKEARGPFCVIDAGWRCADGSGTLGVCRIRG